MLEEWTLSSLKIYLELVQALGEKSGGRLTKPVSAELVGVRSETTPVFPSPRFFW
jgi:hypothetical protein